MSQENFAGLLFKTNLEKHPEVFTINESDLSRIEQNQAQRRAQQEKDNPPAKADLRKEYNQLRQKLFDLQQNAKCFEIRTNESAGKIRLIEERITDLIRLKKNAVAMGNLRGERTYEQSIERVEGELGNAQEEFTKNKHWSAQAARALKEFDGHGRIEELAVLLGEVSPDAKSDNEPK
ncbi:MAG: hypothetical protein ACM3WP_01995 [Acidobacteriota bacterium]